MDFTVIICDRLGLDFFADNTFCYRFSYWNVANLNANDDLEPICLYTRDGAVDYEFDNIFKSTLLFRIEFSEHIGIWANARYFRIDHIARFGGSVLFWGLLLLQKV